MTNQPDDIRLWTDRHVLGGLDLLMARCVEFRYPLHSHDTFVIAAFGEGAQKHQIARHRGVAYPGTVLIIPPGDLHSGEPAERGVGWAYCALYPAPRVLETLVSEGGGEGGGTLDFANRVLEDPALAAPLIAACRVAAVSADPVARAEAVCGPLAWIIERYGQRRTGGCSRPPAKASIRQALAYIHAHFHEPLRLKDIADQVSLSEFHFMRTFKEQQGVTVYRYLTQVRLEAAKALLAAGTPAAEAAVSAGFYDQSHFTGCFRRHFGVTPSRYAKACR